MFSKHVQPTFKSKINKRKKGMTPICRCLVDRSVHGSYWFPDFTIKEFPRTIRQHAHKTNATDVYVKNLPFIGHKNLVGNET